MGNMEFWDKVKQPPPEALKTITGGRLKGMTDIKPIWRMQSLTEEYGPCGIGWKYTIDKLWTELGSENQVFAFATISLFIKSDEVWSDPIPGIGGSMLVTMEKNGLYSNDEGYKMAVTDALSVACKALGIGANIYAGLSDGSKYVKPSQPTKPTDSKPNQNSYMVMSDKQKNLLWMKMSKDLQLSKDESVNFMAWYVKKVGEDPLSIKSASAFIDKFPELFDEFTKSPEV